MKLRLIAALIKQQPSPPTRGAWIEMIRVLEAAEVCVSPPTRGAWIEIPSALVTSGAGRSPPTRGAWIEMSDDNLAERVIRVAPHTGGVD